MNICSLNLFVLSNREVACQNLCKILKKHFYYAFLSIVTYLKPSKPKVNNNVKEIIFAECKNSA